jgi:hypothetical protein
MVTPNDSRAMRRFIGKFLLTEATCEADRG